MGRQPEIDLKDMGDLQSSARNKNFESFLETLKLKKKILSKKKDLIIIDTCFFLYWCYSLSIAYYDSVKEQMSNPYSSILS